MAPTPRQSRRSAPIALAAAAAAAGYLATVSFAPSAWVGPIADRVSSRRLVAAQAWSQSATQVRDEPWRVDSGGGEDMDYDFEAPRQRSKGGGGRKKRIWKWRTPVEDLKVGQEFEGTVVQKQGGKGVFVDIKADQWAWLWAGEIVKDPGVEFKIPLKEGDKVWVRVLHINLETRKFSVTCLPGSLERGNEKKAIQRIDDMSPFLVQTPFSGTVYSLASFGAFISVDGVKHENGENVVGLIHRMDMPMYMKEDLIEGDKVKMRLIKANERDGHISFKPIEYNGESILFDDEPDPAEEEDDDMEKIDEDAADAI